jgi:hypothetical protein
MFVLLPSHYYNITQSSTGDGVRHPGAGNYFKKKIVP